MAEVLLRALIPPDLAGSVEIGSAGTGAADGLPATLFAVSTAAAHELDLRPHRSRVLTPRLVRESDLIVAMERHHAEWARGLAPEAGDRIHVITEQRAQGGESADGVSDPIGGTAEDYDDTFHRIRSHLLRWLPVLREAIERQEGVR
jgi:protein-tyrosine-phosphatase